VAGGSCGPDPEADSAWLSLEFAAGSILRFAPEFPATEGSCRLSSREKLADTDI
jgi:hypothetical protein